MHKVKMLKLIAVDTRSVERKVVDVETEVRVEIAANLRPMKNRKVQQKVIHPKTHKKAKKGKDK